MPYHLSSGIPRCFKSLRMVSLHLLRGPPCGRGWGGHPNSVIFGIRWFGILARCHSQSNLPLHTLSAAVSISPHHCLISCEVMCSSHCCLLVMPSTVRMHLWWKESSFLSSLCRGVQLSDPYSSMDNTHAW